MPYAANGKISQAPIDGGIEISEAQYQAGLTGIMAGKRVSIDGGFSVAFPAEDESEPVPQPELTPEERLELERAQMVVSRFQGRAALHQAGLLEQVNTLINDPETDPLTAMAWEDATEFQRNSVTLVFLADQLGLSDTQVDDLFRQAATIQA